MVFYHHMKPYIMSEEQLVANGYPRLTDEVGVVSINRDGRTVPAIQPVGASGKHGSHLNMTLI